MQRRASCLRACTATAPSLSAAWTPGEAELWQQDMLYDPQTSGGLLIAVAPEDADALLSELEGSVPAAQRVGRAVKYDGGALIRLR